MKGPASLPVRAPQPVPGAEWVLRPQPAPTARAELYCLPYAGGSTQCFRRWPEALAPAVEVRPVALPGRAARIGEQPIARIEPLTEAIATAVARANRPVALFGHSFGAVLAFEVARRLVSEGGTGLALLVVSACPAPHLPRERSDVETATDEALARQVRELGGTPAEVLDDPALLELLLPALRADLIAHERYRYSAAPPLQAPILALAGESDPLVGAGEVSQWSRQAAGPFRLEEIPGGHFFIDDQPNAVLALIRESVLAALAGAS